MQHLLGAFPYVDQYVPLRWRVMAPTKKRPPSPAAAMAQISQNTISSTIALPPREEGTGHHCKRWVRFDVGRQPAELLLGFCARRRPWTK
jgi:hypothetical protein